MLEAKNVFNATIDGELD